MRLRAVLLLIPLVAACTTTNGGPSAAPSTLGPTVASPSPVPSPELSPVASPSVTLPPPLSPSPTVPVTPVTPEVHTTADVIKERPGAEASTVVAVRWATHATYDRVVVEFRGAVPGYRVERADRLIQDGSGDQINVKGDMYLHVTITPANAHDEGGTPTWKGGPIFDTKLPNVKQVVKTGDFEAVVGVGLVLKKAAAFRVLEQAKPSRLVIDVAK